jgi:DNA-binding LacI/PurR family transcriptional regulator
MARETVLNYLETKYNIFGRHASNIELPAVRELADILSVSFSTVHNVYKSLAADGVVKMRKGSGSYIPETDSAKREIRMAINVEMISSLGAAHGGWGSVLAQNILLAAARGKEKINITGFSSEEIYAGRAALPEADGFALIPFVTADVMRHVMKNIKAPYMHITPLNISGTCNFVSPDYAMTVAGAVRAWRESGRKKIMYLHHKAFRDSMSNLEMFKAFAFELGDSVTDSKRFVSMKSDGVDMRDGESAVEKSMREGFIPDAVFTSSDTVAIGAVNALRREGLRVPDDVSVIGGTGFDPELPNLPGLTRIRQPFAKMAERMVKSLCDMIVSGKDRIPGEFLETGFAGGATTTEQENAVLKIQSPIFDVKDNNTGIISYKR